MSQILKTSLLIVGGGPGGYVAAIRAGQLGIPTVLVEGAALGGTCLNVGCIPSKALIHAAEEYLKARHYAGRSALGIQVQAPSIDIARTVEWKDAIVDRLTSGVAALLKKHGVDVVQGWARILDGKSVAVELAGGGSQRIECEHLLLAAGSQSVELPILPLGGKVISSTEALAPGSLPKRLVVVGGGYIGLELGTAYRKLGVEVAVVEAQPRILPGYDEELTKPVAQALRKLGVELYLGHSLLGPSENGVRVRDGAGEEREIAADQVLVAVGRKPRSEGWNLESLGLDMNGRAVKVDDQCRTSMRNVWAIGDLAGEPMLAHRAMAQGEMVAELIAGKRRQFAPGGDPRGVLHRSGSGGRRVVPGAGEGCRPGLPGGELPVRRQRPRHDPGGQRRLRPRGGASRQPPGRRLAGGGQGGLGTVHGLRPVAGDGRPPGRHRRHHPRPSDPRRSGPGSRPARAGTRPAHLIPANLGSRPTTGAHYPLARRARGLFSWPRTGSSAGITALRDPPPLTPSPATHAASSPPPGAGEYPRRSADRPGGTGAPGGRR
ncbi:dihydrolipoamide dehydrogenase [Pseudomonas aeruginosa]|nr:dihydrolipoamide dehydrogenase [Pseudomonas aeruginosa]